MVPLINGTIFTKSVPAVPGTIFGAPDAAKRPLAAL